jgi:DNA polymerase-3 subunit beta
MKVKVSQSALLEGLQTVQNVVSLRSTLPILSNVLLTCDKTGMSLTTTDLDLTIRCRIEAEVARPGATTLPARRLFSIVRELAQTTIELEADEKDVATLSCNSSFFRIIGLSEDEFPPVSLGDGKYSFRLGQSVFRDMLRKTGYAASTDETRHVLNGVLLSFKGGKVTLVATDGRRLALVEQEVEFPKEAETEMIVPSKAVAELLRTLGDDGDVTIHAKERHVSFEFKHSVVMSKLIEGTYPNYRQVIPAQSEEHVALDRESLLSAIKRVSLVTADRSNAMKLAFTKNKLTLTMATPDVGEARETLTVKYGGKDISVAFNPEYMMEPLRNLTTDEVSMELTDDLSPGVIKCEIPFLYVLMPMRIT